MRTIDFPYFKCGFAEFNKAQATVIPFITEDYNLVVVFRTGVGKTAIAECAAGFHLSTDKSSKVIYVSPYKGISSERLRSWQNEPQLNQYGVLLSTSDNVPESNEWLCKRIFIMTIESLDAKLRNKEHLEWIENTSCLVLDEAHIIGESGRGANLESLMMLFTRLNSKARLILLSATMSNAGDLAKWVKSLNNKPTKCIVSNWTPVKLNINLHTFDDTVDSHKAYEEKLQKTIELIQEKPYGEKLIVFVHSKHTGKEIGLRLKKAGIRYAFHNAGVSAVKRQQIEEMFDDSFSGLDVLVSTSTLAAGINLGG